MEPTHVIKRPLITEKSTWEGTRHNRYAFAVAPHATKDQVKDAIYAIYNVRVTKVRTQVRPGRTVRNRFGVHQAGDWKKATVELHPDDRIELF